MTSKECPTPEFVYKKQMFLLQRISEQQLNLRNLIYIFLEISVNVLYISIVNLFLLFILLIAIYSIWPDTQHASVKILQNNAKLL